MFTFLKTPKGLIITSVIVLAVVIPLVYNWDKIVAYFSGSQPGGSRISGHCTCNNGQTYKCAAGEDCYDCCHRSIE